ncbi:hypothetical protein ES707_12580 [subsurface metagenome]
MLAGLRGYSREERRLVVKRFPAGVGHLAGGSFEPERTDEGVVEDAIRLFGESAPGRVARDLPENLEGEEDDELLRRAVSKVEAGEPLSEAESLELLAENQKGRPLSLAADLPVHKAMGEPLNRTRPVESLQDTLREVKAMIGNERGRVVLNHPLRAGARRDLLHKSLRGVVGALFGGRQ